MQDDGSHATRLCGPSPLCEHFIGRHANAKADLAEAARVVDEEFPKEGEADFHTWGKMIPILILQREARALILGADDPIFRAAEATAQRPAR